MGFLEEIIRYCFQFVRSDNWISYDICLSEYCALWVGNSVIYENYLD